MTDIKENIKMFATLLIATFCAIGCGDVGFDTVVDGDVTNLSSGESFPYSNKVETFQQDALLENQVTMSFQAFNSDGLPLTALKKSDFKIYENSQAVDNFSLDSMSSVVSKADIVFVIDKTGSMGDEINGVKQNVRDFVNQLRSVNILANLCLVTFDDAVQDECLAFQADDPATSTNENLDSFLDRLERVQAEGGGDDNENQLAGLMSAAKKTPWRADAQRITILITDEGFSHTGNRGHAGSLAESYPDTYLTLQDERITNYIVGPRIPGYSSSFESTPALADADNFYNINDLVESTNIVFGSDSDDKKKDLGDILKEIASSLTTEYTITYKINENDLNPTLPINLRNIYLEVHTFSGSKVELKPVTATFPNGTPVTRKQWALSQNVSSTSAVKVLINGNLINSSEYNVSGSIITFNTPPESDALIKVIYGSDKVSGGLQLRQIKLLIPDVDNTNLIVYYNGIKADGLDYVISKSSNGIYRLLSVVPEALDDNDKYLVEKNGGLKVTFKIEPQGLNVE